MNFSILHVSDLHRSPEEPITNAELLSSMRSDMHRYLKEDPSIRKPDAIVVTGDVIQGVPLGESNFRDKLREQYQAAEEFLSLLCDEYLDGDRSHVVIVPGNHDVDWNTAFSSMKESTDDPGKILKSAFHEDSKYRWDWTTRKFFEIYDRQLYRDRLKAFYEFHDRFYEGVTLPFRSTEFNIFQLCDGRVGLAAFNSCHGNDCFAFHGAIRQDAISDCHLQFSRHNFELWIAAWHHNVEGGPYSTDYMDIDAVRNMVGRGFRLGLHGHQHRNQVEPRMVNLPESEHMVVVSAGSLCAGKRELPAGQYRQYNVVELDDELRKVRIHVRHMATAQLFSRAHLDSLRGKSFIDFEIEPPAEIKARLATSQVLRHSRVVLEAERLFKLGQAMESCQLLVGLFHELDEFGRSIFLEAATTAGEWQLLADTVTEPRSISELVFAVESHIQCGSTGAGRTMLQKFGGILDLGETQSTELLARISAREALRR